MIYVAALPTWKNTLGLPLVNSTIFETCFKRY